ncbi:hypothetical protein [Streptomyces mirabilis]|uniref:hypothetical protein n=1 Tax=Streptomyces mirabilis TaxID=68239 RepID=UPI0036DA665F
MWTLTPSSSWSNSSPRATRPWTKFKPLLYAEAAIPHFWRLEFDPAPRLIVSELHTGRYVETTTALAGATTRIHAPFTVGIDPAGLSRQ